MAWVSIELKPVFGPIRNKTTCNDLINIESIAEYSINDLIDKWLWPDQYARKPIRLPDVFDREKLIRGKYCRENRC